MTDERRNAWEAAGLLTINLIWPYTTWGGAQIYFLSLVKNAPRAWKFRVIAPSASDAQLLGLFRDAGAEIVHLQRVHNPTPARGIIEKIRRQLRRLRSEREILSVLDTAAAQGEIFHIEAGPWQSVSLLKRLARKGRTFVTVQNALPSNVSEARKRRWSSRMTALLRLPNFELFGGNQHAVDDIRSYLPAELHNKVTISRATFSREDVNSALRMPVRRQDVLSGLGLPPDKLTVIAVGQFIDRKGRWDYLEAARLLKDKFQFIWVGPAKLSDEEKRRIADYEVSDSFRYVLSSDAGKTRAEVLAFFRNADIFGLPSHWEGLPVSILEAMALGLPIVSTRINGIPEAVIEGKTGSLVEVGDSAGFASAIERLGDPALREKLAAGALAMATGELEEIVSVSNVFDRYIARP
ncbi:MAG: glycosyl transferase family protein [Acidobacteria bacterium OLB17]|nr:MAG: glycosyl transferase family protein [Acidobacteria bacterium OLB17]MCZ2392195.1 glycosyltransferase [Acidobacteriota bacterium]